MNDREKPIIISSSVVRAILEGTKTQYRTPVHKFFKMEKKKDVQYFTDGVLDATGRFFRYPLGVEGDRIWVREPFRPETILYKADGDREAARYTIGGWLPSVYMPRWASRLTMDIISVHVELLQNISEPDAHAEGTDILEFPKYWDHKMKKEEFYYGMNPAVFVYEFQVV